MIVVDSNVLAARQMEHEKSAWAEQVERIDPDWIVPILWRYEFQNILAKVIGAGRMSVETAAETWRRTMSAMSNVEHEPSAQKVIVLTNDHRITAYDANFIALAMEMGVVCVTEDRELRKKFPSVAVSMEEFIRQGAAGGQVREARAAYGGRKRAAAVRTRGPKPRR